MSSADDDLRAYVLGIEESLGRLLGREHTLSPRDFALARMWHGAGVPLAVVLVVLDEACQDGRERPTGLAFCRHRVERMAAREPGKGAAALESSGQADVCALLDALIEGIEALRSPRAGVLGLALERARELRAFLSVASRPNGAFLEQKLRELDLEIDGSILEGLEPALLAELRLASERAVLRNRGKVTDEALAAAAERALIQRARERLGLPRSLAL